jgi:hypothetical protein
MREATSSIALLAFSKLPASDEQPLQLFEYYHQPIFRYLSETYHTRVRQSLRGEPANPRRERFLNLLPKGQATPSRSATGNGHGSAGRRSLWAHGT